MNMRPPARLFVGNLRRSSTVLRPAMMLCACSGRMLMMISFSCTRQPFASESRLRLACGIGFWSRLRDPIGELDVRQIATNSDPSMIRNAVGGVLTLRDRRLTVQVRVRAHQNGSMGAVTIALSRVPSAWTTVFALVYHGQRCPPHSSDRSGQPSGCRE